MPSNTPFFLPFQPLQDRQKILKLMQEANVHRLIDGPENHGFFRSRNASRGSTTPDTCSDFQNNDNWDSTPVYGDLELYRRKLDRNLKSC